MSRFGLGVIALGAFLLPGSASGQETIVGKWKPEGQVCTSVAGSISIAPKGIYGDEFQCDFDDVSRSGNVVTWSGQCKSVGERVTRVSIVASLRGKRLSIEENGEPWDSTYVRCGREEAANPGQSDMDAALDVFGQKEEIRCVLAGGGTPETRFEGVDLNGDGQKEFVVTTTGSGNGTSSCFSWAGANTYLLAKGKDGRWREEYLFEAVSAEPLKRGSGQWADLRMGAPGKCVPILRNNGQGYSVHREDCG